MKLSKREQRLVALLLLVIFWTLGFRRMILPKMELEKSYAGQLEELRLEKAELDRGLQLKNRLSEGPKPQTGHEELPEFFYQNPDDIDMDRMLQELARAAAVELLSMKSTFTPSQLTEYAAVDLMDTDAGETEEMAVLGTATASRAIELAVYGRAEAVMRFVQSVNEIERSVLVTELEITNDGDSDMMEGNLSIVFYSLEQ